jgi:hypothetical protein
VFFFGGILFALLVTEKTTSATTRVTTSMENGEIPKTMEKRNNGKERQ